MSINSRVSWMVFLFLAIQMVATISAFSDVPPPPSRPERFNSREELRRYLQLVHEYYAIIGRPRFGRSGSRMPDSPNVGQLFQNFDSNDDGVISSSEFHRRLEE